MNSCCFSSVIGLFTQSNMQSCRSLQSLSLSLSLSLSSFKCVATPLYGLVMTTTRTWLQTRINYTHRTIPRVDNDDEYGRTTDNNTRSHVNGMSVREVLHDPSRTADSSDKEGLSDMWKALATHIFTWWDRADYYSCQQASGLLALRKMSTLLYPIRMHGTRD